MCNKWFSGAWSRHLNTVHPEEASLYVDTASVTFASKKKAKVNFWAEKFKSAALLLDEQSFEFKYLAGEIAEPPPSTEDEDLDGVQPPLKIKDFWDRTFAKTPQQWAQEQQQQSAELQQLLDNTTEDEDAVDELIGISFSEEELEVGDYSGCEDDISESEEDFNIARKLIDFEPVELDQGPVLSDDQFEAFQKNYHAKIKAAREKK